MARIDALERAFSAGVALLDRHSDPDHNRTVFTLAGEAEALTAALARGAAEAIRSIDMTGHEGVHPAIGALDVSPIVWIGTRGPRAGTSDGDRRRRPGRRPGRSRFPLRRAGKRARASRAGLLPQRRADRALAANGRAGELRPDRGPAQPHRTAGATLVTARPPLGAFNVELDSGDLDLGRAVAAGLRESGGGLAGVRAVGLPLSSGRVQVSTNIHDLAATPLGTVVERIRSLAEPLGARPVEAELVGLIPAAALAGYPDDVPIRDFDPELRTIERRLAALS